jgi:hypothetical protein
MGVERIASHTMFAHAGVPGPAAFFAVGLFFVGMAAIGGAVWFHQHPIEASPKAPTVILAGVAAVCLCLGTFLPLLLGARPSPSRPSATGVLAIVSPQPDEPFHGDPATVSVILRLDGATVVPFSSFRVVPNEGHIHLYLDGSLVTMTSGLTTSLAVSPGSHELRAEFVAVDHLPFDPPVVATATFNVTN